VAQDPGESPDENNDVQRQVIHEVQK
jgi:hypothetical protein